MICALSEHAVTLLATGNVERRPTRRCHPVRISVKPHVQGCAWGFVTSGANARGWKVRRLHSTQGRRDTPRKEVLSPSARPSSQAFEFSTQRPSATAPPSHPGTVAQVRPNNSQVRPVASRYSPPGAASHAQSSRSPPRSESLERSPASRCGWRGALREVPLPRLRDSQSAARVWRFPKLRWTP